MKDPTKGGLFRLEGKSYLKPFLLISSLFFLWGFAHSILEVLNPHFQEAFQISKTKAAFVQVAVYGGYFLMALPVGFIIKRWGYRTGVLLGLMLYGLGALLFIPGARIGSFWFFVFSLFVIGCGLTCLETSANPYTTRLGDPAKAEARINLSQSLNGVGWIVGPWVGGMLLFTGRSIAVPYAIVGVVVLLVALLFSRAKLPQVPFVSPSQPQPDEKPKGTLLNRGFLLGLASLLLYVAAQTGVNSFFINYMKEAASLSSEQASRWLAFGGMGLFAVGRMAGSGVMSRLKPSLVLLSAALLAALATLSVVLWSGMGSVVGFFVVYASESIMFPTIFALALRHSEGQTELASSLLVMTIVGGAIAPLLMGMIADRTGSTPLAFLVPLFCYAFIAAYCLSELKPR
ncbi:MAG: MFS transporter [Prevotellaceae bacterium]|nr:MFS transporter [Prevotellaceae bacterium]